MMKLRIGQQARNESPQAVSLTVEIFDKNDEFVRYEEVWINVSPDGSITVLVDEKSPVKLGHF